MLGQRFESVMPLYPSQYVSPWIMKDGTQVTIWPIRSEDEPLMVKFHATLSDRTVYLRYFTSMSLARRTDHERLLHICHANYEREMVLVADYRNPHTGEQHILAVGRLNKLKAQGEGKLPFWFPTNTSIKAWEPNCCAASSRSQGRKKCTGLWRRCCATISPSKAFSRGWASVCDG